MEFRRVLFRSPDSKEPVQAGTELVNWWRKRGEDPMKKLIIFADGLDVDSGLTQFDTNSGDTPKPFKLMGSNMIGVHRAFRSVTNPTFGWGRSAERSVGEESVSPCKYRWR